MYHPPNHAPGRFAPLLCEKSVKELGEFSVKMNRRAPEGRARFPSVFGHRGPYSTGPQPFPAPSPRRFRVCFATALFVLPNSASTIMDHSPRKIKHFFGGHIFHFREIGNVFRRFFLFFQKSALLSVHAFVLLVLYYNFFVIFI